MLLKRLKTVIEEEGMDVQAGFRANRRTVGSLSGLV
jgi:hypothetical protein